MHSYPELDLDQQKNLPALTAPAKPIAAQFSDSTHKLWYCDTVDGPMVLKVCHQARVQQSSFWLGMNSLFQLDFPISLNTTQQTSQFLQTAGQFTVPEVVAEQANQFVLVRYLAGEDLTANTIDNHHVELLAHHLGKLHQQTSTNWGTLTAPELPAKQWPVKLEQSIRLLSKQPSIALLTETLQQTIDEIRLLKSSQFVPVMPDLRWDQLRQLDNDQLAVVDLDAFVRAPRELELVLLEYLLTSRQATSFTEVYCQYQPMPDLTKCRLSYRVLLFLMHVLGEKDIKKWLSQPVFKEI